MVSPKQSGEMLTWCIESALGMIFRGTKSAAKILKRSELGKYLRTEFGDETTTARQVSKMVYKLKKQKYIEVAEGDSVVLTNKAKIKIIDQISDSLGWDGKYRLVSFDIPETKRANRNNFRRAIKRIGFKQVQKSLWVCDRNVGELVEIIAAEYKIEEYVAYFIADKSNVDRYISSIFKNA
ncbi:MAG: CRISPR-associated endonuclease Cas2 [Patescibacteria group bacterium]